MIGEHRFVSMGALVPNKKAVLRTAFCKFHHGVVLGAVAGHKCCHSCGNNFVFIVG